MFNKILVPRTSLGSTSPASQNLMRSDSMCWILNSWALFFCPPQSERLITKMLRSECSAPKWPPCITQVELIQRKVHDWNNKREDCTAPDQLGINLQCSGIEAAMQVYIKPAYPTYFTLPLKICPSSFVRLPATPA
ncbi:hypothetical protein AGOR_G00239260 [Albula goreensis]|uniref:Uncharacterized protein n=1 Tax=Albula goreensis TaxID=1534307 RepID=A0A8T3CFR7_9TELE|nr:hypothetical protein AGOR_G00239260 [Albula goreensis]